MRRSAYVKTPCQICNKDKNYVLRIVLLKSCTACRSMSGPPFDTIEYTMAGLRAWETATPQHIWDIIDTEGKHTDIRQLEFEHTTPRVRERRNYSSGPSFVILRNTSLTYCKTHFSNTAPAFTVPELSPELYTPRTDLPSSSIVHWHHRPDINYFTQTTWTAGEANIRKMKITLLSE